MKRLFNLILIACCTLFAKAEPKKPNIIVFLTDDQGYSDLGCYSSPDIKTPHFDRLAKEGMRFTSAYVGSPVCGPSRSALMTGSYPIRIGEPRNRKALHTIPHTKELMIPEVLRPAGYKSAILGKWHAGDAKTKGHPLDQGFDYFFGTPKYNGVTKLIEQTNLRAPLIRNREVVVEAIEQKEMDQLTTWYTEETIKFITENKKEPFFLYLAHNMPHVPLGVSDQFRGKSKGGLYGDVIEELDWSMGEILKTLKQLALDENTLIIFVSDNGPWIEDTIGDHAGHAEPLRGAKMKSWEGGPRVPFIARWPGKIPAGKTSDAIVTTMDLLPTFAALAGQALPKTLKIDGKDLMPLLSGSTSDSPHESYFYYCYNALHGVRDARWKVVLPRPEKPKWMGWWARMIDEVKTIELYDLDADIGETNNVAKQHPEVIARLMQEIKRARAELGDAGTIGSGARFFDPGKKRPGIAKYKQWEAKRQSFSHPGLLHTKEELAFIKTQITEKKEPQHTAYLQFSAQKIASLDYQPAPVADVVRGVRNRPDIGSSSFSRDSSAAYAHALQWTLTEKRAHLDKAIEILNAWSAVLKSIGGHDARLLIGMDGVSLCNAAELIKHTSTTWPKAEQDRFAKMLREVLYPEIKDFYPTANGNWDASMIQTMIAIGIYLDDRAIFEKAVTYYRSGEGNGAITRYLLPSGQCQESGRDQAHTQMGLGFLAAACEMAWKQGVDLYGEADNRLAKGFEYTAKYNLGEEVEHVPYTSVNGRYHHDKISTKGRGRFRPIYERIAMHYHRRKGQEIPFTLRVVKENRPEGFHQQHSSWGTLLFSGLPLQKNVKK